MKKNEKNLYLLYMLFGVSLVTANAIATKIFDTHIMLFGTAVTVTVGAVCYPLTFLITDIIGEIWGKKEANLAVKYGFICQLVSTLFIIIARYLPAVDADIQSSYITLLAQNWVFVLASLTGYWCSQKCDVYIFHKIRDKYLQKHNNTKHRWIWNNLSTMTSQLVDSTLFVLVAFGFGFKWLFIPEMRMSLVTMIIGQYFIKFILAFLDTPIFYLFTRNTSKETKGN